MRISAEDLEALGWALVTTQPRDVQTMGLLDAVDRSYAARMAGRAAGFAGQMLGENPGGCPACKSQWAAGWREGDTARLARPERVVALI